MIKENFYTKKFTGNIFGFSPTLYSLGQGNTDEFWSAPIKCEETKQSMLLTFLYDDYSYSVSMMKVNKENFQGKIMRDGKEEGSVYLTIYENAKGKLLLGDWDEDKKYSVIIELR